MYILVHVVHITNRSIYNIHGHVHDPSMYVSTCDKMASVVLDSIFESYVNAMYCK